MRQASGSAALVSYLRALLKRFDKFYRRLYVYICVGVYIEVITEFGHFVLKRQIFGRIVIWLFAHIPEADISDVQSV